MVISAGAPGGACQTNVPRSYGDGEVPWVDCPACERWFGAPSNRFMAALDAWATAHTQHVNPSGLPGEVTQWSRVDVITVTGRDALRDEVPETGASSAVTVHTNFTTLPEEQRLRLDACAIAPMSGGYHGLPLRLVGADTPPGQGPRAEVSRHPPAPGMAASRVPPVNCAPPVTSGMSGRRRTGSTAPPGTATLAETPPGVFGPHGWISAAAGPIRPRGECPPAGASARPRH